MNRFLKWIVWLVIIAPLVYLAIIWDRLPDIVPTHFDLQGNADKFGKKNELLVVSGVLAGMSAFVYLLVTNIYRIDPRKMAVENKDRMQRIAFAVTVFMSAVLFAIIYSTVRGEFKMNAKFIFAGVGLLFSIMGNYMYHIKPNYFAGLRLPWTLEDPENWRLTHLLAGKMWFAGGLLVAVACLLLPVIPSFITLFAITSALVIIPAVYSYRLYKKSKNNTHA